MKSIAFGALAGAAVAAPTGFRLAFHPDEFKAVGPSAKTEKVTFTVALKAQNMDVMEKTVLDISNPDSPNYGKWLSGAEVNAMVAPKAADRKAVKAFFARKGAECMDQPTALRCTAPVAAVEKALGTKMTAFEHVARGNKVIHRVHPEQGWTFPAELQGKVELITGLTNFPTVLRRGGSSGFKAFKAGKEVNLEDDHHHKKGKKAKKHGKKAGGRKLQGLDGMIALETARKFYNLDASVTGTMKTSVGAAEFQDDASYLPSDLALFQGNNSVPVFAIPQSQIIGPFSPTNPDTESSLDVDWVAGVGSGNNQWFYTQQDWMLEFTQQLAGLPDSGMPDVFSMSWGWWEGDQCSIDSSGGPCATSSLQNSYNYTLLVDQGFMTQTARGLTFVAASGDSGAHGRTDSMCFSNVTRAIYPGSSQWITAVGGTQVVNQTALATPTTPMCKNYASAGTPCVGTGIEVVASTATGAEIVSGGGFSAVRTTPAWQAAQVKQYLASGATLPGNGNFNPGGRGYPDVAAFAHNVGIFQSGFAGSVDGTSCATPMVAAFISQLNAIRVNNGKPRLGFFNPVLYGKIAAAAGAFNDVTVGNNRCTEDDSWFNCPSCTGFGATAGWDATTGFGTPRFDVWSKVVASLN